jgi:hypothetical protein
MGTQVNVSGHEFSASASEASVAACGLAVGDYWGKVSGVGEEVNRCFHVGDS